MTSERLRGTVVRRSGRVAIIAVDGTCESVKFFGDRVPDVGDRLEFEFREHAPEPGRLRSAREVRKVRE